MRRSGGVRAPPPRPVPPPPPPPAPQPPKQLLKETGAAYGAGYAIGSRLTERGVDAVLDPPSSKFNMELIYEFDTEGGCRAVLVPKAWPDQQGT
ncbi:uncharacterized protein LOC132266836 isoform X4 [Cornus florida]|uniref:uncharacterized protein LOC132266836 isoform X4 n=1 Tax=Cornus florida TaxID=4283 RepID=UPI00289CAF7A|nr:uncharacterized protein LOC132266836 isoform X4 [Cornus florida]